MTESEYNSHLAGWIKVNAEYHHMTYLRLAALIGVHRNTLNRWMVGSGNCSAYYLYRMQEIFKEQGRKAAA